MTFRVLPAAAVLSLLACAASADPKDDVLGAMVKCADTSGGAARLKCFDEASPALRALYAAPGVAGAAAQAQRMQDFGAPKPPQTTAAEFGNETLPKPAGVNDAARKEMNEIEARVVEFAITPLGKAIVTLDNGQIWRQMDGDTATLRFKKNAADNTVAIRRGALGSYSMIVNKHGALAKVERAK